MVRNIMNILHKKLTALLMVSALWSGIAFGMNEENGLFLKELDLTDQKQSDDIEQQEINKIDHLVIKLLTNADENPSNTETTSNENDKQETKSSEVDNLTENEKLALKKIDEFALIDLAKLDQSEIKAIIEGNVMIASHFFKKADALLGGHTLIIKDYGDDNLKYLISISRKIFINNYMQPADMVRIVTKHPECAEVLLKHCLDQHFASLRYHDQARKIFFDVVNAKNIVDVSYNLAFLLSENDEALIKKFIEYIGPENITTINKLLLQAMLNIDYACAPMIASKAITPENLVDVDKECDYIFWRGSIINNLLNKHTDCAKIIFEKAINEQNCQQHYNIINRLRNIDTSIQKHLNKFQKNINRKKEIIKKHGDNLIDIIHNIQRPHISQEERKNDIVYQTDKKLYKKTFMQYCDSSDLTMSKEDAYKTLGLPNVIPFIEGGNMSTYSALGALESQYEKLALQYDHDKFMNQKPDIERKMASIIVAYDILQDYLTNFKVKSKL